MEVIELAQKVKTINYVILRSEFEISDGVQLHSVDFDALEIDAGLSCDLDFSEVVDGVLSFSTHTQVKVRALQPRESEGSQDIFCFELEFSTAFIIEADASDDEALKQTLRDNDWILRRRNAIISHFLGEDVLQKTPFKAIRLPLN